MPGSKCKMPSELNGLHIRHEFRGKARITSSCGGQGRPAGGRRACEPVLKGRLTALGLAERRGDDYRCGGPRPPKDGRRNACFLNAFF